MNEYSEALKRVAKVLKKHFNSLSVEQTIDIASEILGVVEDDSTAH